MELGICPRWHMSDRWRQGASFIRTYESEWIWWMVLESIEITAVTYDKIYSYVEAHRVALFKFWARRGGHSYCSGGENYTGPLLQYTVRISTWVLHTGLFCMNIAEIQNSLPGWGRAYCFFVLNKKIPSLQGVGSDSAGSEPWNSADFLSRSEWPAVFSLRRSI